MTSTELDEELKDGPVVVMVDGFYRYEIRKVCEASPEEVALIERVKKNLDEADAAFMEKNR